MKALVMLSCLLLVTAFAGCDLRSETAKSEMEKFSGTPTPTISPTPVDLPPDPSEVVQADLNLQGKIITVNGFDQKQSVACTKLDRVMINGGRSVVTIKGACRQIMINGDGNQVIGDATIEFVLNGSNNNATYSRYVNGKRPVIKGKAAENTIEKVAVSEVPH